MSVYYSSLQAHEHGKKISEGFEEGYRVQMMCGGIFSIQCPQPDENLVIDNRAKKSALQASQFTF